MRLNDSGNIAIAFPGLVVPAGASRQHLTNVALALQNKALMARHQEINEDRSHASADDARTPGLLDWRPIRIAAPAGTLPIRWRFR